LQAGNRGKRNAEEAKKGISYMGKKIAARGRGAQQAAVCTVSIEKGKKEKHRLSKKPKKSWTEQEGGRPKIREGDRAQARGRGAVYVLLTNRPRKKRGPCTCGAFNQVENEAPD